MDDEDSGGDGDHGGNGDDNGDHENGFDCDGNAEDDMAQVTNHLAKVLCSDNVDDHGDEDENKTKRQKYKGTTASLCCNPKDA